MIAYCSTPDRATYEAKRVKGRKPVVPVNDRELQLWLFQSNPDALDYILSPAFVPHMQRMVKKKELANLLTYLNVIGVLLTREELYDVASRSLIILKDIEKHRATHPDIVDQILECKLFVVRRCFQCGEARRELELSYCEHCPNIYYCDRECQRADWRLHKTFCDKYQHVKLTEDGRLVGNGIAFACAWYNMEHKYKHCHVVHGSLAIGTWYEYGGPEFRIAKDFLELTSVTETVDCHTWLEDDEGKIYDTIQPGFISVAKMMRQELPGDVVPFQCIEGLTREEMKEKYNLTYVPAPEQTILAVEQIMRRGCKARYAEILSYI